jgi:hypothetical protein
MDMLCYGIIFPTVPKPVFRMSHRGVYFAKFMDIRPIINLGRLVVFFLFIIFVIFSRTSMLRDNPLSGILG